MENKGDFGHANNGGTGFRCMYDGGDNQFKIRSGDDDTVTDRLTIERDSGDIEISGHVNIPSGKLFKINDVGIFAAPAFGSAASGVTASADDNSTKLATTAYVDNAAGGSGGTVATFLFQQDTPGTDEDNSTYSGEYGSMTRKILASETYVICFSETSNSTPHHAVELPLLSTVTMGTEYIVRNMSKTMSAVWKRLPVQKVPSGT